MKKLITIMTICFLSFLSITSINGQVTTVPFGAPGIGSLGVGTILPAFFIDVNGGDINISSAANGYRIGPGVAGSNYVLWHNGNTTNIFVGVGAGLFTTNGQNTFVGNNSGTISPLLVFLNNSRKPPLLVFFHLQTC